MRREHGIPEVREPHVSEAARSRVRLLLEAVLFSVLVPGAVWYWIPRNLLELWPAEPLPVSWSTTHISALVLVAVGATIYLTCLSEFLLRGRGIPAPLDHPTELVVTGLYRYVRNPMYVGVLLVLLGEAVLLRSWGCVWYALGWFAFVHVNVIWYEERYLTRRFGDSYRRYQSAVHRWIPGSPYRPAA
jgi:protein-S-isoprenylcysteine O-methyltransferase Ste14